MDTAQTGSGRRPMFLLLPVLVALGLSLGVAACAGSGETADPGDGGEAVAGAVVSPTTDDGSSTTSPTRGGESSTTSRPTAPASTAAPVVYNDDFSVSVAPILAEKCASCHAPGGPGTAHWTLGSMADAADEHKAVAEVIEIGEMPPWPAGGASPAFLGDRSLSDDQAKAVLDWAAAGGVLDADPTTPIEPVAGVVGLDDPDLTLLPAEAYTGSLSTTDDYRCQIYDPQLPDGGWLTGYEFVPDQTEVVHHAIGYVIPAELRDRAIERDGEDGRPGWSCYGSSGLGEDEIFLGWAPGQDPSELPDGSGLWIDPGAFIVVQIHYHYEAETGTPADRSAVAIELAGDADRAAAGGDLDPIVVSSLVAPAEIPCRANESGPLCDRDAAIAAARQKYGSEGVLADRVLALCRADVADFADMTDGKASSSCDVPAGLAGAVGEVVTVLGHEHEIGSWLRITLNPDQSDEKVLLDIPDWNFDWQYNYRPVERIVIDGGDTLRLECGWDRSYRDPTLEPAYVLWADGTDDEMCFATIATRRAG